MKFFPKGIMSHKLASETTNTSKVLHHFALGGIAGCCKQENKMLY